MVQFTTPLILLAIPVIWGVWYLWFRERYGYQLPNHLMRKYLRTPGSIIGLWLIRLVLVASLVAYIAHPVYTVTRSVSVRVPQDITIVLDLSLSMLADDLQPSRIVVARRLLRDFILSRDTDRISLIIFAGKPFVMTPFSTDRSGLMSMVDTLSPYTIRQDLPGLSGTNIGDALLLAGLESSGSTAPSRSILLITDGKANMGINPLLAVRDLGVTGTKVYTVGIGSQSGGVLSYTDPYGQKAYFYDTDGSKIESGFDAEILRELAQMTGGRYFTANDTQELTKVFDQIRSSLPEIREMKTVTREQDLRLYLLITSIVLLVIERFVSRGIRQRYRLDTVQSR